MRCARGSVRYGIEELATADELDDFEAVARSNLRFRPLGARKDFEVAFDGNAPGGQAEIAQEVTDGRAGIGGAGFAVDADLE